MCFDCCDVPVNHFPLWNYSPPVPLVPTYHGRVIPGYGVPPRNLRPLSSRGIAPHAPAGRNTFVAPVVVPGQNHGLHPGRVAAGPVGFGAGGRVPVGVRRGF